jgi:hypothetical protein
MLENNCAESSWVGVPNFTLACGNFYSLSKKLSKPTQIAKSFKYRKSTGTWKLGDTTTHDSMCYKTKRDKIRLCIRIRQYRLLNRIQQKA